MKTSNLISYYQGAKALLYLDSGVASFKKAEVETLQSFCLTLMSNGIKLEELSGFYMNYKIKQISAEFDLLKVNGENVLDIELKSANPTKDICDQLRHQKYYLQAAFNNIVIMTYIMNDGFYIFDNETDTALKLEIEEAKNILCTLFACYDEVDLDRLFIPSQFLISPFNKGEEFINDKYFLTNSQQEIKSKLYASLTKNIYQYYSITADAGCGKTLLLYDIAKKLMRNGWKVLIIHCANINKGQEYLNEKYHWNIIPIKDVKLYEIDDHLKNIQIILIDEAQRISEWQLILLLQKSNYLKLPIIFSYDSKQLLNRKVPTDILSVVKRNGNASIENYSLTRKIRTNPNISLFIENLFHIGHAPTIADYSDITIEYFDIYEYAEKYKRFLEKEDWAFITFTASNRTKDPYDKLSSLSYTKAHNVIGQEFDNVAVALDSHCHYNDSNTLIIENGYYNGAGMLYQILTRVICQLKIIIIGNKPLYEKLIFIKKNYGSSD